MKRNVWVMALMLYGAANAVLYSSLLPLWEGFDEPFHYGYVQSLSVDHRIPVLGRTLLSQEIWRSLQLVPVSHVVRQNIPQPMVYGEYFQLDNTRRHDLRRGLETLDKQLKSQGGGPLNYEAQQAPLAYLILAVPDFIWREAPLPERVWRLRVLCAILSVIAVTLLTLELAKKLGMPPKWANAAVFVALSSQMFYATTAHITNDWLAIPLAILLFISAADLIQKPTTRRACVFAAIVSAGLLTKAYFLSFVPAAFGLVIWLLGKQRISRRQAAAFCGIVAALSGPWYARNLILYKSLSATQQAASGIGVSDVLSAIPKVDWLAAISTMARKSLWTGNNSDTAFSSTTITLMWIVLLLAAAIYVLSTMKRRPATSEKFILTGAGFYIAGLGYATVVLYIYTGGVSKITGQWYTQAIFAPLVCVLFCGLAYIRPAGQVVAALLLWLWGYVMAATYLAKLIPMYGGWNGGPVRLASLAKWYVVEKGRMVDVLATTALAGPWLILILAATVAAGSLGLAGGLSWQLVRRQQPLDPVARLKELQTQ